MSTRIKGTKLGLTFGSTNHWMDITSAVLENEEADTGATTFADAQAGGARQFYFTINAIQSTGVDSFWSYVWENTGEIVAYVYAPHGNPVATANEPHFSGTVKIPPKPSIGGEAGTNVEYTFEIRMDAQEEPTLAITGTLPDEEEGEES
jgi:hypothetical protein